jgi:excisionase family DNA binding protein
MEEHVTVREAARELYCSKLTIYRAISAGHLEARRLGPSGQIRIDRDELNKFLRPSPRSNQSRDERTRTHRLTVVAEVDLDTGEPPDGLADLALRAVVNTLASELGSVNRERRVTPVRLDVDGVTRFVSVCADCGNVYSAVGSCGCAGYCSNPQRPDCPDFAVRRATCLDCLAWLAEQEQGA